MKKILSIIFALLIAVNVFAVNTFAEENVKFDAKAYFTYEGGKSYLMIEGTTPATYSQGILAMVYDPVFTEDSGLETLCDEYGELVDDIAGARPLTDESNIIRFAHAISEKGTFSMKIPIEDMENGQYVIINIGGNGKNSSEVSTLAYYETEGHLNAVTLPAFENATAETIGALLKEKQYLLGISLSSEYEANKERVNSLFVSVRLEDMVADEETGRKITSTDDVKEVYRLALALAALPEEPSKKDVETFVSANKSVIDYDFTEDNNDFVLCEDTYAEVAANILKDTPADSMKDFAKTVNQAVGILMLNSKDSTTIAPVVEKYAAIMGVDSNDYEIYCEEYSAREVNKAFVARNFEKPRDVVAAFKDRIAELNSQGSTSSGGGGGGGSSPSSSGSVSFGEDSYLNVIVKNVPDEIDYPEISFGDVSESHWANEAVTALAEKGILNGFEDGTFRPDAEVTREQFVKMIVTAFDLYANNGLAGFDDVPKDRWSYEYILTAASANIVNGVSKSEFAPENAVSRQDAAVMLARLCKKVGITLDGAEASTDADEISDYAKESVAKLKAAQIISGFEDGSFKPMQSLTRAQAAKLIYGLLGRI